MASAKDFIAGLFQQWEEGDSAPFFAALAPDVIWTAKGTTPISGTVHGKQEYMEKVYQPLLKVFTGPTKCQVRRIVGEGNTVVVEWHGETPTKSSDYAQDYCWLIRVHEDGKAITEVTGYFDTARVAALFSVPSTTGSVRSATD